MSVSSVRREGGHGAGEFGCGIHGLVHASDDGDGRIGEGGLGDNGLPVGLQDLHVQISMLGDVLLPCGNRDMNCGSLSATGAEGPKAANDPTDEYPGHADDSEDHEYEAENLNTGVRLKTSVGVCSLVDVGSGVGLASGVGLFYCARRTS